MVRKIKNKTRNRNRLLKKNIGKQKVSTSNVKIHQRRSSKKASKRNRKELRNLQKQMLSQSVSEANVLTNSNTSTENVLEMIETPTVLSTSGDDEANSEVTETIGADEDTFEEDQKRDIKCDRKQSVSEDNVETSSNTSTEPVSTIETSGEEEDQDADHEDDENTLEVETNENGVQEDDENMDEEKDHNMHEEAEDQNGDQKNDDSILDEEEDHNVVEKDNDILEEEEDHNMLDEEEKDPNSDQEDSVDDTAEHQKSIFSSNDDDSSEEKHQKSVFSSSEDDEDEASHEIDNHLSSPSKCRSKCSSSPIHNMKEVRVVLIDCYKYPDLAGLTGKMKPINKNNRGSKNVKNINGVNNTTEFDEDTKRNSKSDFKKKMKIEPKINKNASTTRQLRTRRNSKIMCKHCGAYLGGQLDLEIHVSVHHARLKEGMVFTTYNQSSLHSSPPDENCTPANESVSSSKSTQQQKKSQQHLLSEDDDFAPEYLEITPKCPKTEKVRLKSHNTSSSARSSTPNSVTTNSKCFICGSVLVSARGLQLHMTKMHMHECPISVCLATFGSIDKLEKHLQLNHPELLS